jgi:hypothetical protein
VKNYRDEMVQRVSWAYRGIGGRTTRSAGDGFRVAPDLWADLRRNPPARNWQITFAAGATTVTCCGLPVAVDNSLAAGRWAIDTSSGAGAYPPGSGYAKAA